MLISMDDVWVLGEMKQMLLPLLMAEEKPFPVFYRVVTPYFNWSQFCVLYIH